MYSIKSIFITILLILLTFNVNLGAALPPIAAGSNFVSQIVFEGNHSFSKRTLIKQMNLKEPGLFSTTPFNKRILKLDVVALTAFYVSRGYINCAITDSFSVSRDGGVSIFIKIKEGKRVKINELEVRGNKIFSEKKILKWIGLKKGDPLNPFKLKNGINKVKNMYYSDGKPFVQIQDSLAFSDNVKVFIIISERQTVFIDTIYYEGLEGIKPNIVEREMVIAPGDIYNIQKIMLSQKRIFETGLFSNITIEPSHVDSLRRTLSLKVKMRKTTMRLLGLRMGVGQQKGISESGEPVTTLNLSGEWGHRNIFGTGRKIRLGSIISINLSQLVQRQVFDRQMNRIEINYTEPWLLYLRSPTILTIFYEQEKLLRPRLRLTRFGINLDVIYKMSETLEGGTKLQVETVDVDLSSADPDTVFKRLEGRDKARSFGLFIKWDTRENVFYPANSSLITIDTKYSGGPLGGSNHFYKIEVSWSSYENIRILPGIVASRFKFGWGNVFGITKEIPIYERFFLGGGTSVRGYEEGRLGPLQISSRERGRYDPVGGNVKLLMNFEFRFPLYWKFGGEIFIDAGNLWKIIEELDFLDLKYGAGAGITFETPLGPVRIDYGYKLNPDPQITARSAVHFGFQYAF